MAKYKLRDAKYHCELPKALGDVTKLKERNGRIVAETKSGIFFIVPLYPERLNGFSKGR